MKSHHNGRLGQAGPVLVDFHGTRFFMPAHWPDVDAYMALFRAPLDAVRQLLPSKGLVPVRWLDGSALVVVEAARVNLFAVRLEDGSLRQAAPFGMVHVGLMVARSNPGRAPIALSRRRSRRHQVGALQLAFPLTSPIGAAVGISVLGEAKFVADMDFVERTGERSVTVTEGSQHVLTFSVRPGGPVTRFDEDLWVYMAPDDQLLSMATPARGSRQVRLGRSAASLELGNHPAVATVKALSVERSPVMAANFVDYAFDEYPVQSVAPCTPLKYYSNTRQRARFTVDFEDVGVIDMYAGLTEALLQGEQVTSVGRRPQATTGSPSP